MKRFVLLWLSAIASISMTAAVNFSNTMVLGWNQNNAPCQVLLGLDEKITMVGDNQYQTVYGWGVNYNSMEWLDRFNFYYRFDDNRVWRYDENNDEDVLLFDFSLEVGEEIIRPDGKWIVLEKSDEEGVQILQVQNQGTGEKDTWHSDYGSLKSCFLIDGDLGLRFTDLLRRGKADSNLYEWIPTDKDYLKLCFFEGTRVEEDGLSYSFDGDVLCVKGAVMLDNSCIQPLCIWMMRNGEDIYLDFGFSGYDELSPMGNSPYSVDIRIGEFTPGTYRIHFWKTEVVELVCEGKSDPSDKEHTAITHTVAPDHSSTLYDLQGRRLKTEPQHGVFIRDRRKIVK